MKKLPPILALVGTAVIAAAEPPNVVFVLADDLGWGDLGCSGSEYYETPNIDALAERGVMFTQAYASAPVCQPTRAAFLTGKNPASVNITAVFNTDRGSMPLLSVDDENFLQPSSETLAEKLSDRGYKAAIIGKWHFAPVEGYLPQNHGFDVNVAGCNLGKPPSYFSPYSNPQIEDGPDGEYLTNRLAQEASDFIATNKDEPFFLYFAPYSPHIPLEAPREDIAYFESKTPDARHHNPVYAAMIRRLDAAVGQIISALDEAGLTENTLIVFTSDNGGLDGQPAYPFITDNAPLRGGKFMLYEGGIRVPAIASWPGRLPEGTRFTEPVTTVDWHATMVAAAGLKVDKSNDGIDLLPLLEGESSSLERVLGWHYPHYFNRGEQFLTKPVSAIRKGNWKLLYFHESESYELYNLKDDPSEMENIYMKDERVTVEMKSKLANWLLENHAQLPKVNPKIHCN